ncbi:DUF6114 domain-containing protein [Halorientalis litorea]|uniref:DUF6114 domain-containing protein n=1 Tax=Halorientalis litorea TaxID=2931977 RepID=UPI001FF57161|nr:DUF6114 domain-containing protein [Halorientalis litorea]
MSVLETDTFGRNEQVAALVGAVVGAVLGGAFIHGIEGWNSMRYFGWLVGSQSMVVAWGVWFGMTLTFGSLFGVWVGRSIESLSNTAIMVSRESVITKKTLVPLLHKSPLTVTATASGAIYGNVIGFGLFAYLFPAFLLLNSNVPFVEIPIFPLADFAVIFGIVIYSTVMGTVYGVLHTSRSFIPENWLTVSGVAPYGETAGYIGIVAAGIVSAVYILVNANWLFRGLAWLVGSQGTFTGVLVWLVGCVALGTVFVAVVSRIIDVASKPVGTTKLAPAAKSVAGTALGVAYGVALGVVAVAGTAVWDAFPQVGLPGVVAFTTFGALTGLYTGFTRETIDLDIEAPDLRDLREPDEEPAPSPASESSASDAPSPTTNPLADKSGLAAMRAKRPLSGSALLILSGVMIAAIPLYLQTIPLTAGMGNAALGIVWGAMVAACGLFALLRPDLSTLAGVTGIAISIISLVGAFGGLVFGMLVGIVGGNLCIAWSDPLGGEDSTPDTPFEWTGSGERQRY